MKIISNIYNYINLQIFLIFIKILILNMINMINYSMLLIEFMTFEKMIFLLKHKIFRYIKK